MVMGFARGGCVVLFWVFRPADSLSACALGVCATFEVFLVCGRGDVQLSSGILGCFEWDPRGGICL